MRFLSLFSGIEAASLAWGPLGWHCVGLAEIEPFPCSLLKHYYPNTPNLGDVTKITEPQIAALGRIDIIIFGSPCQDLSVAGNRKGLAGERSGLFHTAIDIIRWARKHCGLRYALWENVPGAFTSNKGRDFGCVVQELAGLDDDECAVPPKGWGNEGAVVGQESMVEWSTLDSQWFGVAQRRRRVFALADFGDWTRRPPILLEPESMRGDSAPRRQTGEEVAGTLTARAGEGFQGNDAHAGLLLPVAFGGNNTSGRIDVAAAVNAKGGAGRLDFDSETFVVTVTGDVTHALNTANNGKVSSEDGTGRGIPIIAFNSNAQPDQMVFDAHVTAPLTTSQYAAVLAFDVLNVASNDTRLGVELPTPTMNTAGKMAFSDGMRVRRLTPLECERLQGQPDNYTAVMHGNKPAADGPRYKAIGNSMTIQVIHWIGRQVEIAEWFTA